MISSGVYRFLGMTLTFLVAVQSHIHPGPGLPGQVKLLNGELFYTLHEARVIGMVLRQHYNTQRPHSALEYRPPAPETHTFLPFSVSA
jgi:transposase InsO family protein